MKLISEATKLEQRDKCNPIDIKFFSRNQSNKLIKSFTLIIMEKFYNILNKFLILLVLLIK